MKKAQIGSVMYMIVIALASYYFTGLWFELNYEYSGAPWGAIVAGSARSPFQYRVLMPWLVRALSTMHVHGTGAVPPASLWFWLHYTAVLLLVFSFRRYVRIFWDGRVASILAMSIFLVLPYNLILDRVLPLRYPSDIPCGSLCLFFGGTYRIISRGGPSQLFPCFLWVCSLRTICGSSGYTRS